MGHDLKCDECESVQTHISSYRYDADPESQPVTTENTQDAVYNFDT